MLARVRRGDRGDRNVQVPADDLGEPDGRALATLIRESPDELKVLNTAR